MKRSDMRGYSGVFASKVWGAIGGLVDGVLWHGWSVPETVDRTGNVDRPTPARDGGGAAVRGTSRARGMETRNVTSLVPSGEGPSHSEGRPRLSRPPLCGQQDSGRSQPPPSLPQRLRPDSWERA